jgi:bacillithiol biosynthesis deacetylase BshB1
MKTALIIAPHPDDAELAMGGTIAKMISTNWNIIVVDLTDGEPTPFGSREIRATETKKANKILGINKRICLDMPNRYLETTLEHRKCLAEIIRANKPAMLFGPAMPDWHPDHTAAANLIEAARFEAKFHKTDMRGEAHWTPRLYSYYSPHRLEYQKPSFIVDITAFWEKKLAAVKAYKSQLRNTSKANPMCLSKKMEITAKYFGQCINAKYAEPFISSEPISVSRMEFFF